MDVVNNVRECLKTWTSGGDAKCRNLLIQPHCNPFDPECLDILTTAYHTLLCATLITWTPPYPLSPTVLAEFILSVLRALPSSSSTSPKHPTPASIFGDHLVDMIWAVDLELDELLNEARLSVAEAADWKVLSKDVANVLNKAKRAQANAESDKQRIPSIVMKLLEYGIISPNHCRERLESTVLASVGLIQDKTTQDKKEIRTRTGLFYKQNKFNLLREQSEGYSKLTVELTSNLGSPHSPQTGRPTESYSVIEERAKPVWEKVISLIGYFDLDPNRALDIILDVLSQHLNTHYTFFLALLSFSPWSGLYRRPIPEEEEMDIKVEIPEAAYQGKSLDEVLTTAELHSRPATTSTSKNGGARVLAQVLGFKFSYYQSAEVSEPAPRNLYLTAAILIREGFINLEDLYPHLAPKDEDMENLRQEYLADVKARIAGAKNSLLAMAAPLESTSSSQPKPMTSSQPEPKKSETKTGNQKVGLLTSLLAVGAIKPAIAILTKFQWLVDSNTEIADLMIRIMKVSIAPLYDTVLKKQRGKSFTKPRARFGSSGLAYPGPRKPVLTLWAPTPPSTSTTDFVFFFPDWTYRIPLCRTYDDLEDVIEPLLRFIGLHVSRDPLFLSKFLRIGRLHLTSIIPVEPAVKKLQLEPVEDHPVRTFWFMISRQYLLPALSLIRGNAVLTVDVWSIIRTFPTEARWKLYGEWKLGVYQSHPELRIRQVQADRESKGLLRRLSHNTIDSLSGPVAKLTHSNPCIFLSNAVNQIMAYDNLASVVIQALRYVTNMGFDVLVFIVLGALANPDKERVKGDGVNISDWLQSLASFTGMLFKRYSADLTPVVKYIVHQLHNGQTTEIIVLRELIWKMAGIEPLPSLSESQMAAMAGGPALRIEAIASATRGARLEVDSMKAPGRLGTTLTESKLALPLLIQVAQQRQACVYKAPDAHLKSLAGLYDATHGVLLQYLELLTSPSVIPSEKYADEILPSLKELGQDFGICAPICMQILRPVLNAKLLKIALAMQEQERIANEEAEKRLKAALTAKREPSASVSRVASPAIGNTLTVTQETPEVKSASTEEPEMAMEVDSATATAVISSPKEESPWVPELAALFEDVKAIAPGNAYEVIGPGFYLTFWQLSIYDLSPPSSKYDEEGSRLRALSRQEDSKLAAAERSADRTKRLTATAHRSRRDRYTSFVHTLAQEFKEQTISRAFTIKRLAKEKQHWFTNSYRSPLLINSIIEHCVQPRCLLSPMDADFCAQFIKVLHLQGTPGFYTLGCYDRLIGDHVKVILFSCSEYEARNYGRFLLGILRDLLSWHLDEPTYMQENRMKVGGKSIILPGFQSVYKSGGGNELMKWTAFHTIFRKWHRRLTQSFIDCIQTGEFMHVYNAIIVMKEILDVFPMASVNEHSGSNINAAIDRFLETEERGDLKILARSYSASLKRKEADWALPKQPSHTTNGTASPRPPLPTSTSNPIPEKPRNTPVPTGPSAQSVASRNGPQPPASAPSAPRSQIANQNNSISSTKLAMESIPRPEVVKRVRHDVKAADSPKAFPDVVMTSSTDSLQSNDRKGTSAPAERPRDELSTPNRPNVIEQSRPPPREPQSSSHGPSNNYPHGPRFHPSEQPQSRSDTPVMPPPAVPSQTASAQELRETARQTIGKSDRTEPRSQNGSAAPSPRHRSPSPPSRPGTRNPSTESRTSRNSGGKSRSDSDRADRNVDDRRERESRQETREPTGPVGRRDSLTHTRTDRSGRDRSSRDGDKDRDTDRDKDRGRDRHGGDRERDKDRERDRDRDRDRDRERDRERDRDRDRHRRDDKDRDRDVRKDRDSGPIRSQAAPSAPISSLDDRGLPTRPDLSRNRNAPPVDENPGNKRRRSEDEPSDRNSKRGTRKERDDRSRRPSDKEDRNRDSDRRRKDRDGLDSDIRTSSSYKPNDKRILDGPQGKPVANTPSAPRAMGTDSSRKAELMNSRDRHRDNAPPMKDLAPSLGNGLNNQQEGSSRGSGLGSLRSRISDEVPLSFKDAGRDEREIQRKRTLADREPDINDLSGPSHDNSVQASKRPRINPNNRRNFPNPSHGGLARKTLPIDHDKNQRR